jgi:hypothetical protein
MFRRLSPVLGRRALLLQKRVSPPLFDAQDIDVAALEHPFWDADEASMQRLLYDASILASECMGEPLANMSHIPAADRSFLPREAAVDASTARAARK